MSPRAGLTPLRVVEAAAELADERDPEEPTLAAVADRLGVRGPSLYKHVSGLPELRLLVAAHALRELGQELARAAAGLSGDPALRALCRAYREYARRHPGRYAATALVGADDPDGELAAACALSIEVVGAVLAGYAIDGEDRLHTTRALRSALHGFVALEASEGFGLPLDRDHSFERLVDLFAAGLRAQAAEPERRERHD